MARFRTEPSGGVLDQVTGRLLRRQDPEWAEVYVPWLETGNDPDPPAPLAGPTLEERRAATRARIDDVRERALRLGMRAGGQDWDTDPRSRANLAEAVSALAAGAALPAGFTWRTTDNRDIALTGAQLVALAGAMRDFVFACHKRAWALKAAIEASDDPASIDLFAGWPTPFPAPVAPPRERLLATGRRG